MSKSLLRLAVSLCLLAVVLILGAPRQANACLRAVTTKYYAWVEAAYPSNKWCTPPLIGPAPPLGTTLVWQQIGEEATDCDENYSIWGDINTCTSGDNVVTTSTTCTCGS